MKSRFWWNTINARCPELGDTWREIVLSLRIPECDLCLEPGLFQKEPGEEQGAK